MPYVSHFSHNARVPETGLCQRLCMKFLILRKSSTRYYVPNEQCSRNKNAQRRAGSVFVNYCSPSFYFKTLAVIRNSKSTSKQNAVSRSNIVIIE